MRISISLVDYKKLDAEQNYRFELARANKPREAAIIACALARARPGQHASIEIDLRKTKGSSRKELASVYCAALAIDEQTTIAKCEAKYREIAAQAAKSKRRGAFTARYLRGVSHAEWMRLWNLMLGDKELQAALTVEDYELAARRVAELGIKPNDTAESKGVAA
jgi:hypothetical protein